MKRQGISKKLRFEVFARDGFTCRYCGEQSDKVQLVIDHVHPVCQGGTNDQSNLITACVICNQGKSGNAIDKVTTNESHRLALSQEIQEQRQTFEAARAASDAKERLSQEVCNYFCNARGTKQMSRSTLRILVSFVQQHGPELVFSWIDIAVSNLSTDSHDMNFSKYVSGIRRKRMQEGEL